MANKRLERWHLEQLRTTLADFPSGVVIEGESPDFTVQSDYRTVGVEITRFYLPPPDGERPQQEQQNLKDRVVRLAHQMHIEAGGPALYVSVFYQQRLAITKRDVPTMASAISKIVLEVALPASITDTPTIVTGSRLPSEINNIRITKSIDGRDQLWYASAGGWVAPVKPQYIREVIERKSSMVSVAKTKCDELWLVIISDRFSRAAPVELSEEAACYTYQKIFDRVFWIEPHAPRVFELESCG